MPRNTNSILALGLLTALATAADAAPIDARKFGWLTSYEAGKQQAMRTGKPMLVVFR